MPCSFCSLSGPCQSCGKTATGKRDFHPAGPTGCRLRMVSQVCGCVSTGRRKKLLQKMLSPTAQPFQVFIELLLIPLSKSSVKSVLQIELKLKIIVNLSLTFRFMSMTF